MVDNTNAALAVEENTEQEEMPVYKTDAEARLARDEAELAELIRQRDEEAAAAFGQSTEEESEEEVLSLVTPSKEEEEEIKTSSEVNWEKRYGDLRRHQDAEAEKHREQLSQLQAQINSLQAQNNEMPKTAAEVQEWAEQYPDLFGLIRTIAMTEMQEQEESLAKLKQEIEKKEQRAKFIEAQARLSELHPDFKEIRETDHFQEWVREQDDWTQKILLENATNWQAVAKIITAYKVEAGLLKPKRKTNTQSEAAKSVQTKPSTDTPNPKSNKILESQVANMSVQEYEDRKDEIDHARRTGNFEYDLSGAAR